MDGQTVANPGGAVEAPAGDTGTASPSVQTGTAAPTAASPSGASAGTSGVQPRTYRDEDVQKIVRERLADEQKKWEPYKQFGTPAELRARQEKLDRYEAAFKGEQAPKVSAEEKELDELLLKRGFVRKDMVDGVDSRLKAIEQANQQARVRSGLGEIHRLAQEKFGTNDPEVLAMVESEISRRISADEDSMKAWTSGDTSVITKAFDSFLSKSFDPLFKSASARYASGKAKDKAEVPPTMPKGGVQAPLSQERKMTSEERKEAAYKRLQELEGQA